ncbi:MAG: helix-turn-helix domain-containing protein [Actinomycetota bacterium]|nr:helix-turn-helix domain-containing protein [Actinomycetota bacterium]
MPRRRVSPEEALGDALREARLKVGLSQEALGDACDRHRTYISLLERGKHSPSVKTLFSLAEVLETTPSKLLGRVEDLLGE